MFNLLPDNLRKIIKREYNWRRLVIILTFILLFQAVIIVFVLPSWFISFYNERGVRLELNEFNKYLSSLGKDVTIPNIKSLNTKLKYIDVSLG